MSCSALLPEDVRSASISYEHRKTHSDVLSALSDVEPGPSGACSSVPRPEVPLLVKLCCAEAQSLAAERRIAILSNLHCDPSLDVGATSSVLLGAEVEIHVRFEKYRRYPFRVCFLIGIWFPVGYLASIKTFLKAARNLLDLGLSSPLQLFANAQGGFDAAVVFLMSQQIQDFLIELFLRCEVTSLPAERLFNCVKKWETSKLFLAANVSCNLILQRFSRERPALKWLPEAAASLRIVAAVQP